MCFSGTNLVSWDPFSTFLTSWPGTGVVKSTAQRSTNTFNWEIFYFIYPYQSQRFISTFWVTCSLYLHARNKLVTCTLWENCINKGHNFSPITSRAFQACSAVTGATALNDRAEYQGRGERLAMQLILFHNPVMHPVIPLYFIACLAHHFFGK